MTPFLLLAAPASRRLPRAAALFLACGLSALLSACGGGDSAPSAPEASAEARSVHALAVTAPATTVAQALSTGEAAQVPLADLQLAARNQLTQQSSVYAALRRAFFGLNTNGTPAANHVTGLQWDPSHDSSTFTVLDSGRNHVMLPTNWRYANGTAGNRLALGVLGQFNANTRYAAFGGNPMAVPGNAAMDGALRNTIAWLTGRSSFSGFKVVTAHLPGQGTYWFPHEGRVRSWLATQYPGVTINGVPAASATDDSCDGDKLDACLQGADLLVIGRQQAPSPNASAPDDYPAAYNGNTILAAVKAAQSRGIPVLYLHHYRDANDLASKMLDYFGLGQVNNYWGQEGVQAFSAANVPTAPPGVAALRGLLSRLESGSFSTTWSGCVSDVGRIHCEKTGSIAGDSAYLNEFLTPALALRDRLRALDAQGAPLFSKTGYRFEKLAVLLGDKYRESVVYPMDKATSGAAFFRAYFSDLTAYLHRAHNQVAQNLGNFSGLFPVDTPVVSRRVTVAAPASGSKEYVTGLYVMPGRSVTLRRVDASTAPITVGVNLLRDTTWLYNQYDRPTGLASVRAPLLRGQVQTLTSPFGGPLYLFIGAAAGTSVSVQVDGATTHPVLRNMMSPTQVAAFKAELDSTPTNWAVVTTDFLTLHSTVPHLRSTLAAHGGDMTLLADRIWTYMVKDTYELAGFNSESAGTFVLPAGVSSFCTAAGWDCTGTQHRRTVMQHVIADVHAACGSGCSGNPYDQDWALNPLGWGETHEIGHNLQRSRLKVYGGQSTEVSNNIFPSHKQMAFNRAHPTATPIWRSTGGPKKVFDVLKAAAASADPKAAAYSAIWSNTAYAANNNERVNFYRQLVEFARSQRSGFADGWELYTLMYLLDRNLDLASADWAAQKDLLGFGTYASHPASMDGNDFMLIAASRIIGLDMRPVFDLWGVSTSAAAAAQVAAYGLPAAPAVFYPMSDVNRWGSGVGAPIAVTASYPAGF